MDFKDAFYGQLGKVARFRAAVPACAMLLKGSVCFQPQMARATTFWHLFVTNVVQKLVLRRGLLRQLVPAPVNSGEVSHLGHMNLVATAIPILLIFRANISK